MKHFTALVLIMKNAIVAAVVAALVSSGGTYAATRIDGRSIALHSIPRDRLMRIHHPALRRSYASTRPVIVSSPIIQVAAGSNGGALAVCPAGTTPTGGGFVKSLGSADAQIVNSRPVGLLAPTKWWVAMHNASDAPASVQAWAVCA